MSGPLSSAQRQCLLTLSTDNPAPEEPWFAETAFSPPLDRRTLEACARKKLIEIDASHHAIWRVRFRPGGRIALSQIARKDGPSSPGTG